MTAIESLSEQISPSTRFDNVAPPITPGQKMTKNDSLFGENGFTFFDFLDIINPLQHLPIISNIYRSITGDEIDPGSKIAGAAIFGGPIGGVLASMDLAISRKTGQDIAGHAATFFAGGINTETTLNLSQKGNTADLDFSNATNPIKMRFSDNPSANVETIPLKNSVELDPTKKVEASGMTAIPVAKESFLPPIRTISDNQTNLGGSSLPTNMEPNYYQANIHGRSGGEAQYNKIDEDRFRTPLKLNPQKTTQTTHNHAKSIKLDNLSYFQKHTPIGERNTDKSWVIDAMLTGLNKYQSAIHLTDRPQRKRDFINH